MRGDWTTSSYSGAEGNCVEVRDMWLKSSYSCGENNCVETLVPTGDAVVQVRDTKDRGRGIITVGAGAWEKFIDQVA